jgi:hypothetical protein
MNGMSPLVAVLDASVLYSAPLRHLLIALAIVGAFQPRWTNTIQDEWVVALKRDRPDLDTHRIDRTRNLMETHLPDALVANYEPLIDGLTLPDADDRHVLAAAIHSSANAIVTVNLKDFPAMVLNQFAIRALHPDAFVFELIQRDALLVLDAMRAHRQDLKNPPKTPAEYLATLESLAMTNTVTALKGAQDHI